MMNQFINPFDYFEKIYCINLDSRPDRWKESEKEFKRVGILDRVKRVSGIIYTKFNDDKRNACMGNHLSHAECLDDANMRGLENCLIFEDDVKFINDPLDILTKAVNQLPLRWALFYLGVNTERTCFQLSPNIAQLTFAYSTHAYAVSNQLFQPLIEINVDENIIHNDVEYNEKIVPFFNCYSTIPLVAIQRPSYSNIENKVMNYDWMESRFYSNLVKRDVGNRT